MKGNNNFLHGGRDNDSVSGGHSPRAFFKLLYRPPSQELAVVGPWSRPVDVVAGSAWSVVSRTQELVIIGVLAVLEDGLLVEEGDVPLLLEAAHGARVPCVRVAVGAPDARGGGAAELTELVRIVSKGIVTVAQGVHRATLTEKLDGRLDVVVAVYNVHHVAVDQPERHITFDY